VDKVPELVIESVGGYCPCQADGFMHGNPFYFRARHGAWTIEVAFPREDPVCNGSLFYMEGDDPKEGYMEPEDAIAAIGIAFAAFTKKYEEQIYRGAEWPKREA